MKDHPLSWSVSKLGFVVDANGKGVKLTDPQLKEYIVRCVNHAERLAQALRETLMVPESKDDWEATKMQCGAELREYDGCIASTDTKAPKIKGDKMSEIRKLSIGITCEDCKHFNLYEMFEDTFPRCGYISVECGKCHRNQWVIGIRKQLAIPNLSSQEHAKLEKIAKGPLTNEAAQELRRELADWAKEIPEYQK